MKQKPILNPPETEYKKYRDFDLKKLEDFFIFSDFARKISVVRVNRIVKSIVANKFHDNEIKVVKIEKKFGVIDGQHRIEALQILRDKFGLLTYDLVLKISDNNEAREAYRAFNLGRALTLRDHLKPLDDGKTKFFNELRPFCDHYWKFDKPTFSGVLSGLFYAQMKKIRGFNPAWENLDDFVKKMSNEDIEKCLTFTKIIKSLSPTVESDYYRIPIYRNLFRVYYENDLSNEDLIKIAQILVNDPFVKEELKLRLEKTTRSIYNFIIDNVAQRVGLTLEVSQNVE